MEDLFLKLEELIKKSTNAAIFSHPTPDPDAIGSQMGIAWLLQKYKITTSCFFDGRISHPQNLALVNLLDPGLKPVEEYDPKDYDLKILVDTIPSYAGKGNHAINFDIVIDHHKETPNGGFDGFFLNLRAGSCCGTIFHLIKEFNKFNFELNNEYDAKVATAMLVGIMTDTENLMSDDTTTYEDKARQELFPFRDPLALKQIINYQKPRFWVETRSRVINEAKVDDGIAIVGLGIISPKYRDMLPDIASDMVAWEDVKTAIAFAVIDNRIEGSVRSTNASVGVPELCKQLGKKGNGGGKLGKGAYRYELIINDEELSDMSDNVKEKWWDFVKTHEIERIEKLIIA